MTDEQDITIAHFIDSGGLYGAEKMLVSLCIEQIKRSIKPIVVSIGVNNQCEKEIESECRKLGIELIAWRMKPGLNIKACVELLKHLKPYNIQLFHSHGYKFNILLSLLASIHKTQIVTTVHGRIPSPLFSKMWLNQKLEDFSYKLIDRVVCVTANDITKISTNPRKISVIANGIDFDLPKNGHKRNQRKVLYLGRLSNEKGAQLIPTAAKKLASSSLGVTFHMYGEGLLKERIQQQSILLNVDHLVKTLGYCKNATSTMIQFDALIMPSLSEGLPISLLEAVATKTIPIVTKVGEIPNVLGKDYPFYIENTNCTDSVVKAITRFYNADQSFLEDISEELLSKSAEIYSSKNMSGEYEKLYRALLV